MPVMLLDLIDLKEKGELLEESTKEDRAKVSHGYSRDLIKQSVQGAEPTG